MKYSNDKKVCFDPIKHTYTLGDKNLISVTTLISKFKNKFDEDYYSEREAKKRGVTAAEVLKQWREKGNKSCDIGTAIHKIFEDYTDNKYSVVNNTLCFDYLPLNPEFINDFDKLKKSALLFVNDLFLSKRLTPVFSEHIVYNDLIAGQIDMVCKDSEDNLYIIDFKTNSKIDACGYGKYMKGALSFLEDSVFNHYSLQLNIYEKLIVKKIKRKYLIHITPTGYSFIQCLDVLGNLEIKDLF